MVFILGLFIYFILELGVFPKTIFYYPLNENKLIHFLSILLILQACHMRLPAEL